MAVRDIRRWGDPILRTACDPVRNFDGSLRSVVTDLIDTVTAETGRAGLAANQIGIGLRVFVWFIDDGVGHVVNPTVVSTDGEQDGDEGCLSVPGLWFPCRRAMKATVEGFNQDGEPITVSGSGLLGRCLQHETDHLDGMVFLQRLEPDVRKVAMKIARERL